LILGNTFLRNFYVELDMSRNDLKLAKSIYAPDGVSITYIDDPAPTPPDPTGLGLDWKILAIIIAALLIGILCLCLICKCCSGKGSRDSDS
jgi:hypothetical protein